MAECKVLKKSIIHNYEMMKTLCKKNNAQINIVSKLCLSNKDIIHCFYEQNLKSKETGQFTISDSNMLNFLNLDEQIASKITKCVIKTRLSDIKKIPELPSYARPDRLFISDTVLLEQVEKLPPEMQPEIVLITETGDMKDGFLPDKILSICRELPKINIIGISVNFSCLSGILPDLATVQMLNELAIKVQEIRNLEKPFLSVGGTVVHKIAENGELKGLIQEIRSGEGIFFGYDSSGGQLLPGFCQKTIVLCGEILEVSKKDFALRNGHQAGFSAIGHNGSVVNSELETGIRNRAILDFGILAADQKDLIPVDNSVLLTGQTFDFTVVDITDSQKRYIPGDEVVFITNYASASFTMMNRFIPCSLVED